MSGIPIYFDFDWIAEFRHNKSICPNGQSITQSIKTHCPPDWSPALLLTSRIDECPRQIKHGDLCVFVVKLCDLKGTRPDLGLTLLAAKRFAIRLDNIDEVEFTPDAAAALAAKGLSPEVLDIIARAEPKRLQDLLRPRLDLQLVHDWANDNPENLKRLLDANNDLAAVKRWSELDPANVEHLRALTAGAGDASARRASAAEVIQTLRELSQLDPALLDALTGWIQAVTDKPSRVQLLRALVVDGEGRHAHLTDAAVELFTIMNERGLTSATLAQVLADRDLDLPRTVAVSARLVEYGRALEELKEMILEGTASEGQYQSLLSANAWMFGSEYSELCDRRRWTRDDNLDFMLRRTADHYLEIVEIKTPMPTALMLHDQSHESYYPSSPLSKVLGQVFRYVEQVEQNRAQIRAEDHEDPLKIRARIIIGKDGDDREQAALRQLNAHLHGVEVLTFDQLVRIAERVICALEAPRSEGGPLDIPTAEPAPSGSDHG